MLISLRASPLANKTLQLGFHALSGNQVSDFVTTQCSPTNRSTVELLFLKMLFIFGGLRHHAFSYTIGDPAVEYGFLAGLLSN